MTSRKVDGRLYTAAESRVSKKGNEYAVFSINDGKDIWRLRAFGDACGLALSKLTSGAGEIDLKVWIKVDEEQDGDVLTGMCTGFTIEGDEKGQPKKKRRLEEQPPDPAFDSAYMKSMNEKGIYLAKNRLGMKEMTRQDNTILVDGERWVRLDFAMHILGVDKVVDILKSEEVFSIQDAFDNPKKFNEVRDFVTKLAYSDYKKAKENADTHTGS